MRRGTEPTEGVFSHSALELPAASPDGCTEALMLANGSVDLLVHWSAKAWPA
jgi:hypothetical protein